VGGIAQRLAGRNIEIAPPTVNVTATYPGARPGDRPDGRNAARAEINGVDDMLYIVSQATATALPINVV
jgi:multidrug efflux pump subunit AcrB